MLVRPVEYQMTSQASLLPSGEVVPYSPKLASELRKRAGIRDDSNTAIMFSTGNPENSNFNAKGERSKGMI